MVIFLRLRALRSALLLGVKRLKPTSTTVVLSVAWLALLTLSSSYKCCRIIHHIKIANNLFSILKLLATVPKILIIYSSHFRVDVFATAI